MVAMNVWPTDGSSGSVANEARWRKMARHWAPSGVCPGVGALLAPSLAALNLTVKAGAAWVDGHFCELLADQVLAVTANGLAVIRFDPAANSAELLWRDAVTVPAQNPSGVWELPIAAVAGSVLADRRTYAGSPQASPFATSAATAFSAAAVLTALPAVARTVPVKGGQLYLVSSFLSCRATGALAAGGAITSNVKADGVAVCVGQLLKDIAANERMMVSGSQLWTPAADANAAITMDVQPSYAGPTTQGAGHYGWRIEPVQ